MLSIPATGFQYLSVQVGLWIPIVSAIPDSKTRDSEFHKQNFPILDSKNKNSHIPESRFPFNRANLSGPYVQMQQQAKKLCPADERLFNKRIKLKI